MPTPNNTVSLLIAGKTHSQWTDYDIDSDLLTPADDFQVTLGRPVDAKPDAVQPGDTVEVRVGEDTVLSGRIDRVSTTTAKGQKTHHRQRAKNTHHFRPRRCRHPVGLLLPDF